jgi:hypothetical protein
MPFVLMCLGFAALMLAATWTIFSKAGEAGWKALIPVYGMLVFLRLTGRPWWWLLLLMVPVVNFYPAIVLCWDLAKVFGKGNGYALGLLLLPPVFTCMLAFGGAEYRSPLSTPSPAQARAA